MNPPSTLDPKHCAVVGTHPVHVWFTALQDDTNPSGTRIVTWHCAGTWVTPTKEDQ